MNWLGNSIEKSEKGGETPTQVTKLKNMFEKDGNKKNIENEEESDNVSIVKRLKMKFEESTNLVKPIMTRKDLKKGKNNDWNEILEKENKKKADLRKNVLNEKEEVRITVSSRETTCTGSVKWGGGGGNLGQMWLGCNNSLEKRPTLSSGISKYIPRGKMKTKTTVESQHSLELLQVTSIGNSVQPMGLTNRKGDGDGDDQ